MKEDIILLESKHGQDLAGNIFTLLRLLDRDYSDKYKLYLTCAKSKREKIKGLLTQYGVKNVTLAAPSSFKYFKLLARAKFLMTDTSFTTRYIKKEGQVILNTWHGTPLKVMGREVAADVYAMGNIMRNLLFSDFLLYPNEYMKEKMIGSYMIDGIYKGTILNEGYPRNCIFFDREKAAEVRQALGLADKKMFVYMPTWRGNMAKVNTAEQLSVLKSYMKQLDEGLRDDEVVVAKLHPFMSADLDFSQYRHIIPVKPGFDAYEVLNSADCLITDYSSVFYDFANTGKKIILFAYDEQDYIAERGMYVTLDELPFPKVTTVSDLIAEMRRPKGYDDTDFIKRYCTYERPEAAEMILRRVIKGEKVCNEERIYDSSKENVLIFTGDLSKNGITTAALNLIENLDPDKRRYFITFQQPTLKNDPLRCSLIPRAINVFPMSTKPQYTIGEAFGQVLFYKLNFKFALKSVEKMCRREARKFFYGADFDSIVQYQGYGKNMIHLFRMLGGRSSIFVHSDMQQELANKDNQHRLSLQTAYNSYDSVVCVSEGMIKPTSEISGRTDNICIVHNCHAYKSVLARAESEVRYDEVTVSDTGCEELKKILDSSLTKIINIGRFSAEKGHDMLIKAYEMFAARHPESRLIIIGGYGKLYEQTRALAGASPVKDKIILIKTMLNPMPVLKKCDLFVLSSHYEALGLTMLEADTLGVPVISTDIPGPRSFLESRGGYMVPCTPEGLCEGMEAFMRGEVKAMNVDYEEYNRNAVEQFEALLGS
ncbi:MAG: CDP-glycerol glycerophosphotransferase family protein [Ruminococcus sp.]|nr:CDP-glycerol glycerophosphotransferase family protein [Ruminococcus sp.]